MSIINGIEWFPARVVSVFSEDRLIDVEYIEGKAKKSSIQVVCADGSYSMPRVGDVGLVIGDETGFYYLGRLDYGYRRKLSTGLSDDKKELNQTTGKPWNVKLVEGGVTYLSNIISGAGLLLPDTGNIKLLSLFGDGLSYMSSSAGKPFRWLKLIGKTITATVSGGIVQLSVGQVVRKLPTGDSVINDETGLVTAKEVLAVVRKLATAAGPAVDQAKLHLGNIFVEPMVADKGIPEFHTEIGVAGAAAALRAVLAVFNAAGIEVGSVKIDKMGNMSINTPAPGTGLLSITALTKIAINSLLVHLGTTQDVPATEPGVLGLQLQLWLSTHTHATGTGPSGPPLESALIINSLSKKVFLK